MIGAYQASPGGTNQAGQAYVFQNTGGNTWTQMAILNASDKLGAAYFGTSVSVYNDTAVIGAYKADSGGKSQTGQAYVFKKSGSTWNEAAILSASDKQNYYYFGNSVSIYNDTVVVGAPNADPGGTYYGEAYVFQNSGSSWNQMPILTASDKAAGAYFGTSVSVYNDTAVIGAEDAVVGGNSERTSIYLPEIRFNLDPDGDPECFGFDNQCLFRDFGFDIQ